MGELQNLDGRGILWGTTNGTGCLELNKRLSRERITDDLRLAVVGRQVALDHVAEGQVEARHELAEVNGVAEQHRIIEPRHGVLHSEAAVHILELPQVAVVVGVGDEDGMLPMRRLDRIDQVDHGVYAEDSLAPLIGGGREDALRLVAPDACEEGALLELPQFIVKLSQDRLSERLVVCLVNERL